MDERFRKLDDRGRERELEILWEEELRRDGELGRHFRSLNEEQKRNFKNMWMDVKCKELLTDTDRCWVCGRSSEELADMNIELERNEHLREFDYPFKTCDACNTFAELQGSEYAFETRDKIEKLKSLVESISTSVLSFLEKNDQED